MKRITAIGALVTAGLFGLVALAPVSNAANCSSRTDSLGSTYGSCSDGTSWSSRTDSFGNTYGSDNKGNSWNSRSDSFGNSYGTTRCSGWATC